MTAKASKTAPLPDSVDFIAGSTLLHMYLTAHYALINRAQVWPGETVLVIGAAGGVGLACVELARLLDSASSRRSEAPPRRKPSATVALTPSSTIPMRTCGSA